MITKAAPLLTDQQVNAFQGVKKSCILIIDDSETNIKVLGALLKKYNYDVLTALHPQNGISIAKKKSPDLILLDVFMPELNGFDVYKLLKSDPQTSDIPVVYLTAACQTQNMIKAFELGAVDYITKPFNHAELIARIRTHLKQNIKNEHVKALVDIKSHSFVSLNKNLEITSFNTTANEKGYMFKEENLSIGGNIFQYIHPSEHHFVRKRIENAFKGRITEFEKSVNLGFTTKWVNYIIEPIYNPQSEVVGCIISGTDITSKKAAEIEDADFMKKLNDLFEETQQSLSYARYIQNAIFPSNSKISKQFVDSFILYKPKDKVGGDFYWTHNIGEKTLLILGDCTGHGVPGALLTTISIVLLEQIVKIKHIYSPEKILHELNDSIVSLLNQNNGGIKDGMELAVCLFDEKHQSLEFAGAKRSVVIARGNEMNEIKGNRQELGGMELKEFTKHFHSITKGEAFYLFSDGYADQHGGSHTKKFMKKNLKNLIFSLNEKPMSDQKAIFEESIMSWKGFEEQTDDILLIGARF